MVVDRVIFQNNQITVSPCFTFITETGVRLPKGAVTFYGAASPLQQLRRYYCDQVRQLRVVIGRSALLHNLPYHERLKIANT